MMKHFFLNKSFISNLLIFTCVNLFLYYFITAEHNTIPFTRDYCLRAYHYFINCQKWHNEFSFLRALGVYDAQWYLRIAASGYPHFFTYNLPISRNMATFAFYPLFPLIIASLNIFIRNAELSAFIVTILILYAAYVSLYYVITKMYSVPIAIKTTWLLFLFPLSIYYRTYYTEGLFLLLLIWYCYFLVKKQWLPTSLFLSLLCVTRPNGLVLIVPFVYFLLCMFKTGKISLKTCFFAVVVVFFPLSLWIFFNYVQTGNPFAFLLAERFWFTQQFPLTMFWLNVQTIFMFPQLPFHSYSHSQIDILLMFLTLFIIIKSYKYLKIELWLICLLFFLLPLFVRDLASYSRYQLTSFPLFIYLAGNVKPIWFFLIVFIFSCLLFVVSLHLVNWYWIE